MRYIFIAGGNISSVGKGIIVSSIASLLLSRGYKVRIRKIDPYLNEDAGTINPTEHGEVFVTEDGTEADIDLGNYERFTGITTTKKDVITGGNVMKELLKREREGYYLGETVQIFPHLSDIILEKIKDHDQLDFIIYEIGGVVGDYESQYILESISTIKNAMFIYVGWLIYLEPINEWKTKPIQLSIRTLRGFGIHTNMIVCRSEIEVPQHVLDKVSKTCNVDRVFSVHNSSNIYRIPTLCRRIVGSIEEFFNTCSEHRDTWTEIVNKYDNRNPKPITIGIIGKYSRAEDSYKSLIESIEHASLSVNQVVKIIFVNSKNKYSNRAEKFDGIIVPGGFDHRETENMIDYIHQARTNNIPFLGICLGMQLAVIEFSRNVLGITNASSEEFNQNGTEHVIVKHSKDKELGGTMRLGNKKCIIYCNKLREIYKGNDTIEERHRHRYDVSPSIRNKITSISSGDKNIIIAATSEDKSIVEAVTIKNHKFFICVQYHPEFKSNPNKPHPLLVAFLEASRNKRRI